MFVDLVILPQILEGGDPTVIQNQVEPDELSQPDEGDGVDRCKHPKGNVLFIFKEAEDLHEQFDYQSQLSKYYEGQE